MDGHRGDHAVQQLDQGKEEIENTSEEALADAAIQPAAARATTIVAVGRFTDAADADAAGGGAAGGGGVDENTARAEEEGEEGEGPPISWVQDEVLCIILSLLDAKTLMIAVPQVCKFWRSMCQELDGVHLDFRWGWRKVPLEVFAGWLAPDEGRRASGMCALFPGTTSVAMRYRQEVEDAHLLALADKCRGLTHATFDACSNLTDAAVLELADKCRGLTHVRFKCCRKLTDAAVLELADKCRGMTHVDFGGCGNLTDAAVLELANKCRGLTHANFSCCYNLTDAAVLELADKCRGLTHANFGGCFNLTGAAKATVKEQRPNCKFYF